MARNPTCSEHACCITTQQTVVEPWLCHTTCLMKRSDLLQHSPVPQPAAAAQQESCSVSSSSISAADLPAAATPAARQLQQHAAVAAGQPAARWAAPGTVGSTNAARAAAAAVQDAAGPGLRGRGAGASGLLFGGSVFCSSFCFGVWVRCG